MRTLNDKLSGGRLDELVPSSDGEVVCWISKGTVDSVRTPGEVGCSAAEGNAGGGVGDGAGGAV